MKSFGAWLQEDVKKDLVIAAVKYKIVHGHLNTADTRHEEQMGRRRAAAMGINFDQLESEIRRTWKPGGCPKCGGLGMRPNYSACSDCGATGFQGMNDQQTKWWLAKEKELDGMIRNHSMWKSYDTIHSIPKMKIAQDIITAAKRAGVPVRPDFLEWPDDPEGLHSEAYQGHEQDYYLFGLNTLLHRIAEAMYKKYNGNDAMDHVWGIRWGA